MFHPDLKTLLLIISINQFLIAMLMVHLRIRIPHIAGIKEWAIGIFLTSIGLFLLAIFPWPTTTTVDFLFSFSLNLALMVGDVVSLSGFLKFKQQPVKKYLVVFPVLVAVNVIVFTLIFKILFVRIIINQLLFVVVYTIIAFELWKGTNSRLRYFFRWSGLLYVFYGLMQVFRVIYFFLRPPSSPLENFWITLLAFSVAGICMIMLSFNLVIIVSTKLNDELHEEIDAKNKLHAIISHDLRGAVCNTLNYTSILKESFEKWEPQETKQWLYEMEISSSASRFLLENLLYWSRSQLKEIKVNAENAEITSIIRQEVKLYQREANLKSVEFFFDSGTPVFAEIDVDMVQIVLRNVISNAIKFTGSGGKVTISLNEKDDVLKIIVSDNGLGISASGLKKIMDRNQTYYTNGTSNEKGSGFGLQLCRDLMKLNNGELKVESSVGAGTVVTILLPKKQTQTDKCGKGINHMQKGDFYGKSEVTIKSSLRTYA